jgi:hypothetical protein
VAHVQIRQSLWGHDPDRTQFESVLVTGGS